MPNGNPELRTELHRLTVPPTADLGWLDTQIAGIAKLTERIAHSIQLHERHSSANHEFNCFMFALSIKPDAVRDMCSWSIFPGKQFMRFLVEEGLLHERASSDERVDGDLVIYFRNGDPEHAGRWNDGDVVSKWGSGGTNIWRHALWEVPAEYGDEVRFFAPLATAIALYRDWAAENGL